jgi:O-antigen ligase
MLMLSGFRPPVDHEWLEPIFARFKVAVRFLSIVVVGSAVLLYCRFFPKPAWQSAKLFVPISLFCLYAIGSTLWSPLKPETLGQAGSFSALVLLGFACSLIARNPGSLSKIVAGFTTLVVLICLILLVTGLAMPLTGHMTREGEGLGHATNSGSSAAIGAMILILSALLTPWRWPRPLLLISGPILLAVMIISANRLSMAITFSLLATALCLYGSRYLTAIILITIGTVGTAFLIVDPDFESIYGSAQYLSRDQSSEEIGSLSGRSAMWEMMIESFMESPLIGHGYFVTSAKGESYMWYASKNWTAHNLALQALVTTGIIGSSLLLLGLSLPAISFFRSRSSWYSSVKLKPFTVIMLLWYCGWGILNESFLGPLQPESVIFFSLLGIMVGSSIEDRPAVVTTAESVD